MAVAKYKQYYQQMKEQNQALWAEFAKIHQAVLDSGGIDRDSKLTAKFHQTGQRLVDVIRDWDRRLCSAMGRGAFSKYSEKLSEKFWAEAAKEFELIYSVGVKKS